MTSSLVEPISEHNGTTRIFYIVRIKAALPVFLRLNRRDSSRKPHERVRAHHVHVHGCAPSIDSAYVTIGPKLASKQHDIEVPLRKVYYNLHRRLIRYPGQRSQYQQWKGICDPRHHHLSLQIPCIVDRGCGKLGGSSSQPSALALADIIYYTRKSCEAKCSYFETSGRQCHVFFHPPCIYTLL